ncbi:MAG: hypothetical protein ACI4PD_02080 [Butyricicoccus sp.]
MDEKKEILTGEALEQAIAAADEYDESRVAQKADYVESDEKYAAQPDAAPEPEPEPTLSIEEEFPDYVMPLGLQQTWVRGTNRYQLMGAVIGYAASLILLGLLGLTGIYEGESSLMLGIIGMMVGYGGGHLLTKKKKAQVEADIARMRAERDAQKAE